MAGLTQEDFLRSVSGMAGMGMPALQVGMAGPIASGLEAGGTPIGGTGQAAAPAVDEQQFLDALSRGDAGGAASNPNFAFARPQFDPLAESEKRRLEQQVIDQGDGDDNGRALALASMASQLPQFGAQVGAFIDQLNR